MNYGNKKVSYRTLAAVVVTIALIGFAAIYTTGKTKPKDVTLITHDSFVMSNAQVQDFQKKFGYTLHLIKAGDAGQMVNRLILTKSAPIADAVFGIDNTFAGSAEENGLIDGNLIPTDFGDVCMNYDKSWFATHHLAAPTSIDQLTTATYKGLTVVEDPKLSSTGLSFLATTVEKYGADYVKYWKALSTNGLKVDNGWETAYYTDFSGSSGHGKYPIVLSYASSPADEIRSNGVSQTASIMDGCFKQTEYVGILKGAKNPTAAKAIIDYLLAPAFQQTFPSTMYMYPIDTTQPIPSSWKSSAPLPGKTYGDNLDFNHDEKTWLAAWSAIFG